MTPEHLAVIDNFKCDNCGKCEACLLIEKFVANEKILKKKGTLDERLVAEYRETFGDSAPRIAMRSFEDCDNMEKWLRTTFSLIRANERARLRSILEDTIAADGFIGFTDKEWENAQKILNLVIRTHLAPTGEK